MNYEKKLALAKEALESGSYDKETIEYIFPELKEFEDDRIRKEIIGYLKSKYESPNAIKCDYEKWIAWLENQGEQKPLVIDGGKAEMDYCFTKIMNGENVSSAWSEEDENILKAITYTIVRNSGYRQCMGISNENMIDWLQSLKNRFRK